MIPRFIPYNQKELWAKKLASLTACLTHAFDLFERHWHSPCAWEWLMALDLDIKKFDWDKLHNNIEANYFLSLVEQIDWKGVENLKSQMEQIKSRLTQIQAVSGNPEGTLPLAWRKPLADLSLKADELPELEGLIQQSDEATQQSLLLLFETFADSYQKFSAAFSLIAAALLYYRPKNYLVEFADFEKQFNSGTPPAGDITMRYLGEAFYGRNAAVRNWAIDVLHEEIDLSPELFKSALDQSFFIATLYLSFYNFSLLSPETRLYLIAFYAWPALTYGVPVENLVNDFLAAEPFLTDFITSSGTFADLLKKSPQRLALEQTDYEVGNFIVNFEAFGAPNDLDGYKQLNYIDNVMKEKKLAADFKQLLVRLLSLYLRLRECTLTNYHGYLEEEKVIASEFDFKKIIKTNIDDDEAQKIKAYFTEIQRPFWLRVRIIVALMSVSWQDEPYFSRAVALNAIYEEVYGLKFGGPIIYFDGADNQWRYQTHIPQAWDFDSTAGLELLRVPEAPTTK